MRLTPAAAYRRSAVVLRRLGRRTRKWAGRAARESAASRWLDTTSWALRRHLRAQGASDAPLRPAVDWINTALASEAQVEEALREVRRCGLPPHKDRPKSWDALAALRVILERTGPDAAVLEAGATLYSVILPWLFLYGYRDLRGIDLVFDAPVRRGPIRYEPGDLTRTAYPDGRFDAIACLSVIEHGVDPDAYFREASRLLKPGGVLVTSTDYWEDPVDTGGQEAFGVPIRIFTRPEVEDLLKRAEAHGLEPTGPVDLACQERAVAWPTYGLRYTFLCFALTKRGG
jgi:SAM-dependent methyltransferase